MKRRFYIVAFYPEKESKLILTALVCTDDVEVGPFAYSQEIAIDGVAYDIEIHGIKYENGACDIKYVDRFPYGGTNNICSCTIVNVIPQDFEC